MLVADAYLGTVDDPDLQSRLDGEESLAVTLDETERRRSRVRTTTEADTPIGIVVGRELRDGDVLDADGTLVVVSLADVAAMVVDFTDVEGASAGEDSNDAVLEALRLGHAVGNRHWDLAVDGSRAYLPVTDDRDRMAAEVRPHLPEGATVAYDEVSPALFDEENATSGPEHAHDHDRSHGHGHSHDRGTDDRPRHHDHSHANDHHDHSHADDDHEHHPVRSVTEDDPTGGDGS